MGLDDSISRRFAGDRFPPSVPTGGGGAGASSLGDACDDGDEGWGFDHRFTTKLRWLLFPAIFLVYLLQTVSGVAEHSDGAAEVAGYAILAGFCAAYLVALQYSPDRFLDDSWRPWWVLLGLTAISGVEAVFAHEDAFVMLIYVVVIAISRMGAKAAPVAVVAIATCAFVPPMVPSWHAGIDGGLAFSLAIVSMSMWAFFGIVRVNRDLGRARAEVAQLAAENERSRIARDLHDLLGHSLTSITVKAGLAKRLADQDPERAAIEIGEVEELARQSLADVRAAVGGYREVTVAGELASGRELLRAAGIEPRLPGAVDAVAPGAQELFGWVVREGITNVVRHARARTCEIRLGPDWVEVLDDGDGGSGEAAGKGLTGLRERVDAARGTVTAGPDPSGRGWLLRVEVPTSTSRPAASPTPPPTGVASEVAPDVEPHVASDVTS